MKNSVSDSPSCQLITRGCIILILSISLQAVLFLHYKSKTSETFSNNIIKMFLQDTATTMPCGAKLLKSNKVASSSRIAWFSLGTFSCFAAIRARAIVITRFAANTAIASKAFFSVIAVMTIKHSRGRNNNV